MKELFDWVTKGIIYAVIIGIAILFCFAIYELAVNHGFLSTIPQEASSR